MFFFFPKREVLASEPLLNIPTRADWKECKQSREEEEQSCKQVRDDFQPYDFSWEDWGTQNLTAVTMVSAHAGPGAAEALVLDSEESQVKGLRLFFKLKLSNNIFLYVNELQ